MSERHYVMYSDNKIEYEIIRKNVKNINLTIKPDTTVVVSASDSVSNEYIEDFIKEKSKWILKNIRYFKDAKSETKSKRYVSGESFRYLGKQYRLKIIESDQEYVKYYRGYIHIYVNDKNDYITKERLLNKWLYNRCKVVFNKSLDNWYKKLKKYNIERPILKVRNMRTMWGSCNINKGLINVNSELIKASKDCIDYVILHELVHLIHNNHSRDFYYFMYVFMPDWKIRKEILDREFVLEI